MALLGGGPGAQGLSGKREWGISDLLKGTVRVLPNSIGLGGVSVGLCLAT